MLRASVFPSLLFMWHLGPKRFQRVLTLVFAGVPCVVELVLLIHRELQHQGCYYAIFQSRSDDHGFFSMERQIVTAEQCAGDAEEAKA
jgi:hypothetical protein